MSPSQKPSFVYISVVEVKPLEGCQLDPQEFAGAAVSVYIPAPDGITAMESFLAVLKEGKFLLVQMEFFVEKNSAEWEIPEEEDVFIAKALETNDVVFGEFEGWGHEEFQ